MTPAPIPTTDHDQGAPPLYTGSGGALVPVLLDRYCWALLLPGDQLAEMLLGTEPEAA